MNKIKFYSPKKEGIIESEISGESVFEQSSFHTACESVFIKHREFVCHEQIYQYVTQLSKNWNIYRTIDCSCVDCFYKKGKPKTKEDNDTGNTHETSLMKYVKNTIDYLFKIKL